MFPEHCRFVVGVFVTENGDVFLMRRKCFCKPGAEGSLSRATGAVGSDNDKPRMSQRFPRPKANCVMQSVEGSIANG